MNSLQYEFCVSNPKISVIVPIFNTKRYLSRCLDSIVNQTFKEIEIICVDDKSTDGSLEILQEYAAKDLRIKVVTSDKNRGPGFARNKGLEIVTGEYIGFVDSDDFISPNFLSKLYGCARATGADIIKGDAVDADGNPCGPDPLEVKKNKYYFTNAWWSAIYRRDFIKEKEIKFPEDLIVGEDAVFLARAIILSDEIRFIDGATYHYMRREESMDPEVYDITRIRSAVKSANLIADFINETDMAISDYSLMFEHPLRFLLTMFHRAKTSDDKIFAVREALKFYSRCKCKDSLSASFSREYFQELADEYGAVSSGERHEMNLSFKLFKFITLLKISYCEEYILIKLFGFIPIFTYGKRKDRRFDKLSKRLPVMERK